MSIASEPVNGRSFVLKVFLALSAGQLASSLGAGLLCYCLVLAWGAVRVFRHSADALWVGVLQLAFASLIYPTQTGELGGSTQGSYRPFVIVVVCLAVALASGRWFRVARPNEVRPTRCIMQREIAALSGVILLAIVYSYFASLRSPGFLDILRWSSGWTTLLVFIFLGYRVSPSAQESQNTFLRFYLSALAYSLIFLIRFMLLSASQGIGQTAAGFGYSQRDLAFYAGVAFTLFIGEIPASGFDSLSIISLSASFALITAALLSGSRSVVLSSLLAILLLAAAWRRKLRWLMSLAAVAVVLLAAFGMSLGNSSSARGRSTGVSGYISARFLTLSPEDLSLLARTSEFIAVADAVRKDPIIGNGILAPYWYFDPLFGWRHTTFVDSGVGTLLMKTGLLGVFVFSWFAVSWLKMVWRARETLGRIQVAALASFLFYLLFLPFGPSFFEFQHSWFIGLVIGQIVYLTSISAAETIEPDPSPGLRLASG